MRRPGRLAPILASLLASLASLVGASGCGGTGQGESRRSVSEWAADVWNPSPAASDAAAQALRELARSRPQDVVDAVAGQLVHPRPAAKSTSFKVALDAAAAKRLGLEALDAAEAIQRDLVLVRRRILDAGYGIGSLRADATGTVEIVLFGERPDAESARLQRFVCRPGALDLRAVLEPPTRPGSETAAYPEWFAAEVVRFEVAARNEAPYVPSRPDRRIARQDAGAGKDPFVALEEPAKSSDAFDERILESARGFVRADGKGAVTCVVRSEHRAALTQWTTRLVGREMAVVRDGVVVERTRLVRPVLATLELVARGERGDPPDEARLAREDAAVLAGGRIPRPLEPVPLSRSLEFAPANAVSKLLVTLAPASVPALERIANDTNAPPWSKRSASWALAEIRRIESLKPR